jgi:phytoene synthase
MGLASALKGSNSSFAFSFSFLPREQKEALRTVYAFCRTTDDIVDDTTHDASSRRERLLRWGKELDLASTGSSQYPLLNTLHAVARKFNIPVLHFHELLRGVEMDLTKTRYETFEELKEYCFLVASSVGLMSIEIFGPRNERSRQYAIDLGIALQLTNILRDVGTDARFGRIYLPREDLRRFGCPEEDLLAGRYTGQFRRLMEFEAERAEEYFRRAQTSLPREDARAMFAPKIMERIYFHTLRRIRQADYNVFDRTVQLPRLLQLLIAVKYWAKHRLLGV